MEKKIKDRNQSTILLRDFFCSTKEPNLKFIGPIYTKNFISYFVPIGYSNQYLIYICLRDSYTNVIKSFLISGRRLDIKKRVYYTMVNLEDSRIKGGEFNC